ncbi:MAG: hypothetical protein ACFFDN_17595 [Candidatus Hodarchaeota archaeon]
MEIITKIPYEKLENWIKNLPYTVIVDSYGVAVMIESWRYSFGLKPIEIIIVREQ